MGDKFIYSMLACEHSLMPAITEDTTSFYYIWKFNEQCSYYIITKKVYN